MTVAWVRREAADCVWNEGESGLGRGLIISSDMARAVHSPDGSGDARMSLQRETACLRQVGDEVVARGMGAF